MISGAEIMAECLKNENVQIAFGYPGAAICPFLDYLYRSPIKNVLVREEQNAAHEASGYARASGKPGVCVATSGPGATNLITGIATAYMDSIPLIVITGQVSSELLGRDVFQEADITGACEPFTKHSYLVKSAADLPRIFKEAFHIASTGRPGPVLIDVPVDIQAEEVPEFVYPQKANIIGYKPRTTGHAMQIKKALAAMAEAKRPVLVCGGGVVLAGARDELVAFAQNSGIPVVSTMMGIGVVPMNSPLYLGMIGMHGHKNANRAMHEADLIILCGARVGDRAVSAPEQMGEKATIIHIDIDPAEIGKNVTAHIPIVGDIRLVLRDFIEQSAVSVPKEWIDAVLRYKKEFVPGGEPDNSSGFVEPRSFMRVLSSLMEEDAILTADVGQNQIWAARNFNVKEGRFLTSGGLGTMGYALPAAIGAKLAKPRRQVLCICGDGSFQMAMCELGTLCQNSVNIKIIVMQNDRLGMVKEIQDNKYGSRYAMTLLQGNPDFVKIAQAYGIPAALATSNEEAERLAREMFASDRAFILVCRVNPDAPTI
ncbi:biosynthetic-type acetolactate synthase large subunit [Caproiciproducens sp. R2]|uniref:biosynthetic-type acetolactate synthase large subunit n=1 Tax=Caproiciproducens sp. R2 TaxID=3435187 RepID=UPI004033BD44